MAEEKSITIPFKKIRWWLFGSVFAVLAVNLCTNVYIKNTLSCVNESVWGARMRCRCSEKYMLRQDVITKLQMISDHESFIDYRDEGQFKCMFN